MVDIRLNVCVLTIFFFLCGFCLLVLVVRTGIKSDRELGVNALVIKDVLHLEYSISNLSKCRKIIDEIPELGRCYLRANFFKKNIVYVPFRRELYIELPAGDYLLKLDKDFHVISSGYLLG